MELITESRLRLKRTNVESSPKKVLEDDAKHVLDKNKMNDEFESKDSINGSFEAESDSILDFKSPKSRISKLKLSEFCKPSSTKPKKRTSTKFKCIINNQKQGKSKQRLEKNTNLQVSQPSIESSFFKCKSSQDDETPSVDVKVALVCPLCFKTFKDGDSQALHMKICAYKNNISTKKLLDAIDLQKRQEDERKSLGLLAAPVVQEKKKSVPRKPTVNDDSDLHLALALSKSLQEAEELDEISEIEGLTRIPSPSSSEISELARKRKLEEFGFANNKPSAFIKSRKRKLNKITVLQTRSQEERNRILTERIAEILMGNEPITQNQKENEEIKGEFFLKRRLLRETCYKEDKLWDKAKLTPNQKRFYVTNLSEHIIPKEIVEIEEENNTNFSQCETEVYSTEKDFHEVSHTELCLTNEDCENCEEKQFINTLVTNWGNALNDSAASDIIILVNDDKHVWAHKLIFYTQCSNILLDVMPNDIAQFSAVKEKICWFDLSYDIALAFLEFIYCRIIKKYLHVLANSASFSTLRKLARKYKVKELFAYLRRKEIQAKQPIVQMHSVKNTRQKTSPIIEEKDNLALNRKSSEILILNSKEDLKLDEYENSTEKLLDSVVNKSVLFGTELQIASSSVLNVQSPVLGKYSTQESKESTPIELSPKENNFDTNNISCIRHSNVSPDMFDDTIPSYKKKCINRIVDIEKTKRNTNLGILNSCNEKRTDTCKDEIHINEEDTVNSSKSIKTISFKSDEKYMKSLMNTPPSSKLQKNSENNSDMVKVKSNLSLFIEQFQKENAKSDFDSDSEVSMLLEGAKLNRNPFDLRKRNHSDQDSMSYRNATVEETVVKKKDVWEQLDYNVTSPKVDIDALSEKSDTTVRLGFDTIENLMESLDHDTNDAEYSTSNNTKNTSINESINSPERTIHDAVTPPLPKNLLKNDVNSTNLEKTAITETSSTCKYVDQDSIDLSVDSDDNEISMYAQYKRTNKNNSIIKYRDFVKKHVVHSSIKCNSPEREESEGENNVDNNDVTILSDVNRDSDFRNVSVEYDNQTEKRQSIFNVEEHKHTLRGESFHASDEIIIDEANKKTDHFSVLITSPVVSPKNIRKIQRTDNSSKLRYSKSENDINLEALRNNSSVSPMKQETNKFDPMGSPVLVSSSPELDFDAVDTEMCRQKKTSNRVPNFEESSIINHLLENDIYLANVHIDDGNDDSRNFSLATVKEVNQSNAENFGSKCNEKKEEILPTATIDKHNGLTTINNFLTQNLRSKENSLNKKTSIRKFQKKSISESHLTVNTKNITNDLSEPQCKCGSQKILRSFVSPIILRDNITPPPNYEAMDTPELHVELNKYGLKVQKRSRAVKLLTYIYNELHPTIPTTPKKLESDFAVVGSEDEEPPIKKFNYRKSDVDYIDDDKYDLPLSQNSSVSMQSPTNIMNEERQLHENEPMSEADCPLNIRDAFLKLITANKELHNKVLAYEPLCLDFVHSMLKAEGFKCKMNTLMDFLDEQCITFYCRDADKQKKDKKKLIST